MRKIVVLIVLLVCLNILMGAVVFAAECQNAKENPCNYDYENYLTDSYNGRFERLYNENEDE